MGRVSPPVRVLLGVVPEERAELVPEPRIRRGILLTLEQEGVDEAEISVTFVSDEMIQRLNRDHLGHDRTTDVLSFALHGSGSPPLGDIYIGLEQAVRQAREWKVPLDEELVRLAIHGTLHVLGYDHPEGEGREDSLHFQRQEALVRRALA